MICPFRWNGTLELALLGEELALLSEELALLSEELALLSEELEPNGPRLN